PLPRHQAPEATTPRLIRCRILGCCFSFSFVGPVSLVGEESHSAPVIRSLLGIRIRWLALARCSHFSFVETSAPVAGRSHSLYSARPLPPDLIRCSTFTPQQQTPPARSPLRSSPSTRPPPQSQVAPRRPRPSRAPRRASGSTRHPSPPRRCGTDPGSPRTCPAEPIGPPASEPRRSSPRERGP